MTVPQEQDTLAIAAVLHTNASDLLIVAKWLEDIGAFLGPDPYLASDEVTDAEVSEAIAPSMRELGRCIETIRSKYDADFLKHHLAPGAAEVLNNTHDFVLEYCEIPPVERPRPPMIRMRIRNLLDIMPRVKGSGMAHGPLRLIREAGKEVERALCWYDLRSAQRCIADMMHQNRSLRQFYAYGASDVEECQTVGVDHLLNMVLRDRGGFAQIRNIDLRVVRGARARIKVRKAALVRALGHLLNNAIKYNYTLKNNRVWVKIETYERYGRVFMSFENWGTPITSDEVSSRILFSVGRRGAYASSRGRGGYGIGLSEASRIVESHGGTIVISSVPAVPQTGADLDYTKPFITKVTVDLPTHADSGPGSPEAVNHDAGEAS